MGAGFRGPPRAEAWACGEAPSPAARRAGAAEAAPSPGRLTAGRGQALAPGGAGVGKAIAGNRQQHDRRQVFKIRFLRARLLRGGANDLLTRRSPTAHPVV
jgi:hypothetical protein